MFSGNHSKIDITGKGVKGPAGHQDQRWQGRYWSKGRGPQGPKGETASNNDVVNKAFCDTTCKKKSDDNQLLKLGNRNRWDADGKIIYDLSRAQYDDEAVTLRQMKDITDKKIDIDKLLPETLKSRLLIPDYHRSDNSDKDLVNRKDVNDKIFNLDVLRGLDMKGNKVIDVEDPISAIVTISVRTPSVNTTQQL